MNISLKQTRMGILAVALSNESNLLIVNPFKVNDHMLRSTRWSLGDPPEKTKHLSVRLLFKQRGVDGQL